MSASVAPKKLLFRELSRKERLLYHRMGSYAHYVRHDGTIDRLAIVSLVRALGFLEEAQP